MIAGTGSQGNANGSGSHSSFSQLKSVCVEEKAIFVTDCQTGSIKLVTPVKETVRYLGKLRVSKLDL